MTSFQHFLNTRLAESTGHHVVPDGKKFRVVGPDGKQHARVFAKRETAERYAHTVSALHNAPTGHSTEHKQLHPGTSKVDESGVDEDHQERFKHTEHKHASEHHAALVKHLESQGFKHHKDNHYELSANEGTKNHSKSNLHQTLLKHRDGRQAVVTHQHKQDVGNQTHEHTVIAHINAAPKKNYKKSED